MTQNSDETSLSIFGSNDPFAELDRVFDDLTNGFGSRLHPFPSFGPVRIWHAHPRAWVRTAPTDVKDTGSAYTISVEVPGVPKDRLEVEVHGSTVEIRAAAETKSEAADPTYVVRERSFEGFHRVVELPEPVVAKDASAKFTDGVLEVTVPKQAPTPAEATVKVPVA